MTRRNTLRAGERLNVGEQLTASNTGKLVLQPDGNLVIYRPSDGHALWGAGTQRKPVAFVEMQADGNLVAYDRNRRAYWSSRTQGHAGARAVFQDDGNFVVYTFDNQPRWSTRTNGWRGAPSGRGFLSQVTSAVKTAAKVIPGAPSTIAAVDALAHGGSLKTIAQRAAREAMSQTKMAQSIARTVAPVASLIPGLGTAGAAALAMAANVGHGMSLKDMALSSARAALPGGPAARLAFDMAAGLVHGENVTTAAMHAVRNSIPGSPVVRAAFDAGVALASKATTAQKKAVASRIANPEARAAFSRAVVAAHHNAAPVVASTAIGRAPAMRAAPKTKRRARKMTPRARSWVLAAVKRARRTETSGLDAGGTTYTVEPNDSAWRIANKLTGNGNLHYKELIFANSPPKTVVYDANHNPNFKYLKVGEVLKIPAAWKLSAQTSLSAASGLPVPTTTTVTSSQPTSATAATSTEDAAAIAQAKLILVAWERTDGAAAGGLPDYGSQAADQSPSWGSRDVWQLSAFEKWVGSGLPVDGVLTQRALDVLVAWAEKKGIAVTTTTVSPTSAATASTTVSPSATPLGEIPVTGYTPAPAATTPATSTKPAAASVPVVQASFTPTPSKKSSGGGLLLLGLGAGALLLVASGPKKRAAAA